MRQPSVIIPVVSFQLPFYLIDLRQRKIIMFADVLQDAVIGLTVHFSDEEVIACFQGLNEVAGMCSVSETASFDIRPFVVVDNNVFKFRVHQDGLEEGFCRQERMQVIIFEIQDPLVLGQESTGFPGQYKPFFADVGGNTFHKFPFVNHG